MNLNRRLLANFYANFSLYEMSYNLPYVLNRPIQLFLLKIFMMSVEVDILHNTSMLQGLLQICKVY